ncbi:MAG: MetQ/NlpA family ABC transporter substrate-binding protein [Clostridiales bacterium]|jgi:D-methionine transport system substrate-binding protein|nr:MetQ/NlpA family ABC transporter substrate-binding protein [Clostridiales bacterium]
MKKVTTIASLLLAALLIAAGCTSKAQPTIKSQSKITVGATSVPHAILLELVKEDLAAEGVELVITEFGEYTVINPALADGTLDANFFQHTPYLDDYIANSGEKLIEAGKIHIEPMGVYSEKLDDLADLPDGAVVGIPNDGTNEGRSLLLLQSLGLITLKEGAGLLSLPADIVDNPKNLEFVELEAAMLPRSLSDTDISVINTNYALEADLNPIEDALGMENADSPFANVVAIREADKDSEAIKKLVAALQSEKVREFILETYGGAVVPAF